MACVRILIADDHSVVRQGIRTFLGLELTFDVIAEARTGAEAITLSRQLHPDVVLMDLVMPEVDGLQATAVIRQELPDTEVIALTSYLEDGTVRQAMQAGAIGYLLKDAEAAELRNAIKAAAAGRVQLAARVTARLMQEAIAVTSPEALTQREKEVLQLLARGQSNREIAQSLQIGETTTKTHVRSILSKLGVSSRVQATLYAIQNGLA